MDTTCSEKCLLKIALLQFDWQSLGHRLLNTAQDVKDIDHEEKEEQHKREKMLLKWKEQKGSGATYQKLTDTLKEIGNMDTAEGVEKLAVAGNAELAQKLDMVQTNCGSIDTLKEIGNKDTAEKVEKLAVEGNAELAQKLDMVQTNCGCGECDFESLISNGCPTPRREPFKFLDMSSLTQKEKGTLLLQLQVEADTMFEQLDIIVETFNNWMEENVPLKEYKKILLSVQGIKSGTKKVAMLNDRKDNIKAAEDHSECSAIVADYYSWFNCSILEKIVRKVKRKTQKDAPEFISSLQSYKDHLHKYCRRNIYECPAPSDMSSTKGTRAYLVLKVTEEHLSNDDGMDISAEKIEIFTAELMKPFEIHDYALKLCTVGKGCMELVYSLPLCIYNKLFPLSEDQCKSLPMLGVMEVITKDYHYKKDDITLRLQQPLPFKMIGADAKQEEVHHVQEGSPSVLCGAGVEEKESTQMENPSTQDKQTISVPDDEDTLQQPLPSKTIGADEKQEEVHHVQEDSPSVLCDEGFEEKESTQMENPSTQE